MAQLTGLGNVRVRCPGCGGATSTYEWLQQTAAFGVIAEPPRTEPSPSGVRSVFTEWRLMRCAGCGRGGLAAVDIPAGHNYANTGQRDLRAFHPEVTEALRLPREVPAGIAAEFREAERCLDGKCFRAAAGLFRSVLDKTLRANGYKVSGKTTLYEQIEMAAADGIITAARKRRAHDEIRSLGNDVLHDDWIEIKAADVEPAHQYAQRILEDFYDDRPSTLALLKEKGRVT